MDPVNGKDYPLWGQFVDGKEEWIGGVLHDLDKEFGCLEPTEIVNIELLPNGEEHALFQVVGKDYTCGFNTSCGGVGGNQLEGWLTFSGYAGHQWRIKKKGQI